MRCRYPFIFFFFVLPLTALRADPEVVSWSVKHLPRLENAINIETSDNTIFSFFVDDLDADGLQEVCMLRSDNNHPLFMAIRRLDEGIYAVSGHAIPKTYPSPVIFPLSGRGKDCFLYYRYQPPEAWLDLYDHRLQRWDSLETLAGSDKTGDGRWNGTLYSIHYLDLDSDGDRDILARFNTGADQQPRAVVAYDVRKKKPLFDLRFAPMVMGVLPCDIDGDMAEELLVSLAGASDGPFFGPFQRDSSYVAVFTPTGRLLAKRAYGGESSYVNIRVADLDNDSVPEIIAGYFSFLHKNHRPSGLEVLQGTTLTVKSKLIDIRPLSLIYEVAVFKPFRTQAAEIVVGDLDGHVAIIHFFPIDHSVKYRVIAQYESAIKFVATDDVNQDGYAELFFYSAAPGTLWVVDQYLKPLAWMPIQIYYDRIQLIPIAGSTASRRQYLLFTGRELFKLTIPVDVIFPPAAVSIHVFDYTIKVYSSVWLFGGAVLFFVLCGLAGYAIYLRSQQRHKSDLVLSHRIGQATIDTDGRISACNPYFLQLIDRTQEEVIGKAISQVFATPSLRPLLNQTQDFIKRRALHSQEEVVLSNAGKTLVLAVELMRPQLSSGDTTMALVDLTMATQQERLKIWAAMAMRMAHKTKTPLATVLLAVQRLQRASKKHSPQNAAEYDELSQIAIKEIERVRDSVNTFMKFAKLDVPSFTTEDLSHVVQLCLQDYLVRVPDEIEIKTQFESMEMPVAVDISQFREAFYNFLDNAITALKGRGAVFIYTLREKHPLHQMGERDRAVLEITDTGTGISEEERAYLFTPGFTTSDTGTGMGLVLAKNIIESHNGTVELVSHPPHGTSVFVRLPIVEESK